MGTYCKDRYFDMVGGRYDIRYYPAPDAPSFEEWTTTWKNPYQAAKGIRERIYYDVGKPINGCQHWKYDCKPQNGECTTWDPWSGVYGQVIACGGNCGCWSPSSIRAGWLLDEVNELYPDEEMINGVAREYHTFVNNGCVDKQLDGSVSLSESPGWLDYKDSLLSKRDGLLKKLAGSQLFYAFGLAPMAGDLVALYKAFCEVPKVLSWLKATNKVPQKIKIVKKIPCSAQIFTLRNNFKNTRWAHKHTHFKGVIRAGATVTYDVDDTEIKNASYEWEVTKRALGLVNPLTFIWEKIPFSFVLDWFIGIGDVLDRLGSYDIFHPVIKDAYYSILMEGTIDYGVNWETRTDHGYQTSGTIDWSYYNRNTLPTPAGLGLSFNTPGVAQLINAAALGIVCKSK